MPAAGGAEDWVPYSTVWLEWVRLGNSLCRQRTVNCSCQRLNLTTFGGFWGWLISPNVTVCTPDFWSTLIKDLSQNVCTLYTKCKHHVCCRHPVSLRPRTVLGEADPRTTASRYGVLWLKKSPDITWLPHSDSDYKYSIKIESKQRHIKISPWVGEPQNYPSYFYGVTARLSATSAKIFSCTGKKVANRKFNIWVSGACKRKHKRWNHASCYYYQRK